MFGNYLLLGIVLREWLRNQTGWSWKLDWEKRGSEGQTDTETQLQKSCHHLVHGCSDGTPPRNAEPYGGYDIQSLSIQKPEEGFAYSLIPAQGRLCQQPWVWITGQTPDNNPYSIEPHPLFPPSLKASSALHTSFHENTWSKAERTKLKLP